MSTINLDNCSSTRVFDEVLSLHKKLNEEYYYNTNAMSDYSFKTNNLLQLTKQKIKKLLNYNEEVVFTSGATMSNNIIIQGFFKNNINRISSIVSTKVEHPSIVKVIENLDEKINKFFINFNDNHEIDFEQLEEVLKNNPSLVSTCLVNNTTGLIVDYKRLYKLTQKYNSFLHLDITQALCKIDFDFNNCDYMSCSMHKINGLKGCGLILHKKNVKLAPILYGGSSDNELYPGTSNAPAFITIGKTIELALKKYQKNKENVENNKKILLKELQKNKYIKINTIENKCSNYVLTFCITKLTSEIMLNYLDQHHIIISSGSACSSKIKSTTTQILKEYNFEYVNNALRICFSYETKTNDIMTFIKILNKGLEEL